MHVEDLRERGLVDASRFAAARSRLGALINPRPYVNRIAANPAHVIAERPFRLQADFGDSRAGARLVSIRVESMSHSIRRLRALTKRELRQSRIDEPMPAMAVGLMEVQITLYDGAGRADRLTRLFPVFPSNPVGVLFVPAGRTLRLSDGAATFSEPADSFSDNTNFLFINGDNQVATLHGTVEDATVDQNGNLLDAGSFDFGGPIVLAPMSVSFGWWYNIEYFHGNAVYNRLRAGEQVATTYTFRFENDASRTITSRLTWAALRGPRINIIRVGAENFSDAEKQRINDGIAFARGIYEQLDFTIGDPVDRWIITVAQAGDRLVIDDGGEAKDLTEEWTVQNDKLDVFVSLDIHDASGWSPVGGPCDKDASGWSGSVVDIEGDAAYFGNSLAHEMGHYLGLDHVSDPDNFIGNGDSDSNTGIRADQVDKMAQHCFVRFLS